MLSVQRQVRTAGTDLAILDEEEFITGHSSHRGPARVEQAIHIMEPGDEEATIHSADQITDAGVSRRKD